MHIRSFEPKVYQAGDWQANKQPVIKTEVVDQPEDIRYGEVNQRHRTLDKDKDIGRTLHLMRQRHHIVNKNKHNFTEESEYTDIEKKSRNWSETLNMDHAEDIR